MDEIDFKRHLRDLVHGHHHPEEHHWGDVPSPKAAPKSSAKRPARRSKGTKSAAKRPRR